MWRLLLCLFTLFVDFVPFAGAIAQEGSSAGSNITNLEQLGEGRLILQYMQYVQDRERISDSLESKRASVANDITVIDSILGMPERNESDIVELKKFIDDAAGIVAKIESVSLASIQSEIEKITEYYSEIRYDFESDSFRTLRLEIRRPVLSNIRQPNAPLVDNRLKEPVEAANRKIQELNTIAAVSNFNRLCLFAVQRMQSLTPPTPENSANEAEVKSSLKASMAACVAGFDPFESAYKANLDAYNRILADVRTSLSTIKTTINAELQAAEKNLADVNQKIIDIGKYSSEQRLTKEGVIIDPSAQSVILMTLVAWTVIIGLIVASTIYILKVYTNTNWEGAKENFSFSLFLEMMTVFLLTGTILVLGISNKIQSEGLAALIGGISGYVLGKMHSGRDRPANVENHAS